MVKTLWAGHHCYIGFLTATKIIERDFYEITRGESLVCVAKILSVKLIVRMSGRPARVAWGSPLSQIQIARIYALSPTGIYPSLLFTYPFICFAPISPDREFLCLHAPGACNRKASTCEHFTAAITQFSRTISVYRIMEQ